jgi:hypothetical protein
MAPAGGGQGFRGLADLATDPSGLSTLAVRPRSPGSSPAQDADRKIGPTTVVRPAATESRSRSQARRKVIRDSCEESQGCFGGLFEKCRCGQVKLSRPEPGDDSGVFAEDAVVINILPKLFHSGEVNYLARGIPWSVLRGGIAPSFAGSHGGGADGGRNCRLISSMVS